MGDTLPLPAEPPLPNKPQKEEAEEESEESLTPLCVFDLDECLVHAEKFMFEGAVRLKGSPMFYVKLRPNARRLLEKTSEISDIAIWSAGTCNYVFSVVAQFFSGLNFRFIWTIKNCLYEQITLKDDPNKEGATLVVRDFYKPLSKVAEHCRVSIKSIIAIDDRAENAKKNKQNLLHVPEWCYSDADDTLIHLEKYVQKLVGSRGDCAIGEVDKSQWMKTIASQSQAVPSTLKA